MKLDFTEVEERIKVDEYQEDLDTYTQEYWNTIQELVDLRARTFRASSAAILNAKKGVEITLNGVKTVFKASNEEERIALLEHILGEDYLKERELELKIKFYDLACKNKRQSLSAEQSKMSVDKTVAMALATKQLG